MSSCQSCRQEDISGHGNNITDRLPKHHQKQTPLVQDGLTRLVCSLQVCTCNLKVVLEFEIPLKTTILKVLQLLLPVVDIKFGMSSFFANLLRKLKETMRCIKYGLP